MINAVLKGGCMSMKSIKQKFLRIVSATFVIISLAIVNPLQTAASASPVVNGYPIPDSSSPTFITSGSDGALWFTDAMNSNSIFRMSTSGHTTKYDIPSNNSVGPISITKGEDGNIWFAENFQNKIGRITTSGVVTEYTIPGTHDGDFANAITLGPDGNIWFTVAGHNEHNGLVGKISTDGTSTVYTLPTSTAPSGNDVQNVAPSSITSGGDGALWFTESAVNKIGRITTTGEISEYPVVDSDISPSSLLLELKNITLGPDGNIWFTSRMWDDIHKTKFFKMTQSGQVTEYPTPYTLENVDIRGLASGPDNALWFTVWKALPGTTVVTNEIGRVTTSGEFVTYPFEDPDSPSSIIELGGITSGPDNNLWFSETYLSANEEVKGKIRQIIPVAIDNTPPSISYTSNPLANNNGWNNTNVTVTFTCNDSQSGVDTCSSPVTFLNEGSGQSAVGTAVDKAGNSATASVSNVNIDKTAPGISSPAISNQLVLFSANVAFSANTSDVLSGVVRGEYYIDTDPGLGLGSPMTYSNGKISASRVISGAGLGQHRIFMRSLDKAGNWSLPVSARFTYIGF